MRLHEQNCLVQLNQMFESQYMYDSHSTAPDSDTYKCTAFLTTFFLSSRKGKVSRTHRLIQDISSPHSMLPNCYLWNVGNMAALLKRYQLFLHKAWVHASLNCTCLHCSSEKFATQPYVSPECLQKSPWSYVLVMSCIWGSFCVRTVESKSTATIIRLYLTINLHTKSNCVLSIITSLTCLTTRDYKTLQA